MSFKFIQNKDCQYFPCHDTNNPDKFNCKFCLCPLYFTDCDGDYKILDNGVKDCSNCMIPHKPGSYDKLIQIISNRIDREMKK
ncbi:cysteine-rich small domain-containing protein [Methanonatronarchaeum sp. AMET6-2]|uniref:cysteine-rich small domain-containing protein n=1 Tax=Methanonatronarchaeum sp. AMET6-2 TaxID=2933293 RepID=UPI001FF3E881|nr:cysteine-rich small domain-containing protein [Methanonatronarchaeum sp. AMET6-2]UOY09929.1 cysteine-rich small domain-containing protein [Methanonatronarchaeum sp. AMET6-2]